MKALITGISGQDGSYLAEFLLEKGYEVYGLVRRSANPNYWRIEHILDKIKLVEGDLLDQASLNEVVSRIKPDEIYNLAAQSFVGLSWNQPEYTTEVNGLGALRLLEAIKNFCPRARFYQASTSEMFGGTNTVPQNEGTQFCPKSPYGISKLYAHHITLNYRESYGLFAVSGILFNHESPRRGEEFVTRKITRAVGRIKLGLQDRLELGNLEPKRDWGHAKDYVVAMWLMLQSPQPKDYVVGTGETHSVKEFVQKAFEVAGLDWSKHVVVSDKLYRPAEVYHLVADPSKIKKELGWQPTYSFEQLVKEMVEADLELAKKEV
ncbi:MAG: GDP-mannose 4,6-dehydratase [Deltaproteobacteria bacterium]|nr:GDP-mannose 4,6-dehydratase [Deltaproteobacteria bacterium]